MVYYMVDQKLVHVRLEEIGFISTEVILIQAQLQNNFMSRSCGQMYLFKDPLSEVESSPGTELWGVLKTRGFYNYIYSLSCVRIVTGYRMQCTAV